MQYQPVTAEIVDYIREKFGCEPEFLWARTPNSAAIRHAGSRKWFAALLLNMPPKTLGLPGEERVDVLNLKGDPRILGSLVDGERYLPGYHMNKEHWVSVLLDGRVPPQDIFPLIDMSYALTDKKK